MVKLNNNSYLTPLDNYPYSAFSQATNSKSKWDESKKKWEDLEADLFQDPSLMKAQEKAQSILSPPTRGEQSNSKELSDREKINSDVTKNQDLSIGKSIKKTESGKSEPKNNWVEFSKSLRKAHPTSDRGEISSNSKDRKKINSDVTIDNSINKTESSKSKPKNNRYEPTQPLEKADEKPQSILSPHTSDRREKSSHSKKLTDYRLIPYNKRIAAAAKQNKIQECWNIINEITENGLQPNVVTYNTMINFYVRKEDVKGAYRVFDKMITAGVTPNEVTYTTLINLFVRKEDVKGAYHVFDKMISAGVTPNEVTYTTLINLFVKKEDVKGAYHVFDKMIAAGVTPNKVTYTTLINLCVRKEDVKGAYHVFEKMIAAGVTPNEVTYTTLINFFVRKEDVKGAYHVFNEMIAAGVTPTVVTYTTLINLFVRKEDVEGAYHVFDEMITAGVTPNEVTFNTLINLCVRKEDVKEAYHVFDEMITAGVTPDVVTFNTLIDVLEKAGSYKEAIAVFKSFMNLADHINNDMLDLHELSHGAAYIAFLLYFDLLKNTNNFSIITGIGLLHSKYKEYSMRDYIKDKIDNNFKQLICTVDKINKGKLNFKFRES